MHDTKQHVRPKTRGRPSRRPLECLAGDMLRQLFAARTGPVIVAIGGPGGTGKSTFARTLADELGAAAVLPLDDYKTSREVRRRAGLFGPHPEANEMGLIAEHLHAIRRGETFAKPVYNATTGDARESELFQPARWTIVEGEVATYAPFRSLVDFSLFIDAHWRTQLATRLGRDLEQRNYSLDKAVDTFLNSNLREFVEHGAASKNWADVHVFCHDDYRLVLEAVAQPIYEATRQLLHHEVERVDLNGLIVCPPTPFAADGGIARRAFLEHLAWLSQAGVERVLVGGSSGEGSSLSGNERLELLKLALEYFPGLVLFQLGGGPPNGVVQQARQAEEWGAFGIVCAPPCTAGEAPREGVVGYFRRVVGAVEIPVIIENHGGRPWPAAVFAEMAEQAGACGVKGAGNDSVNASALSHFCDIESDILRALQSGATGVFSPLAAVFPECYTAFEKLVLAGDWAGAESALRPLQEPLSRLQDQPTATLKYYLNQRLSSYPVDVRLPLIARMTAP